MLSFREDGAGAMAGAVFMSNTDSREQCFRAGIFGLPSEYTSFVSSIKKGMPLFLFDHNLRTLYGVFEAASDGGYNINRSAFSAIQRSYPAQVRINIVWKCRPLSEDEFYPAIEDNYYQPRKFYFDLSFDQVVRLCQLFEDRRVEHPIQNYPKNELVEAKQLSKRTPNKRSLSPDVPHSIDHSSPFNPDISAVVRRYSTSMHTVQPPSVEVPPNTSMPLVSETFGAQIAPMHGHHEQTKFPCQTELVQAALITNGVSSQVSAPYSQTTRHQQLVPGRPYPFPHNILSSGCLTQNSPEGAKFVANQSYPVSHGCIHNCCLPSGYVTQNPTYGDRNHVNSTSTPYAPSYPQLPLANQRGNADYKHHSVACIKQCCSSAHDEIHAYQCQHFSEGKALQSAKLSQQGIPAYRKVPEYEGNTIPAIGQQKSSDFILIPDCDEDFENGEIRNGTPSSASDSSDLESDIGVDKSDPRHTKHAIGAESNTKVLCSKQDVFSRLSGSPKPPVQTATNPTLSQLISSLSQRAIQWRNGSVTDGVSKHLIQEQVTDRPYSHSELNLPFELEFETEPGESMEPQLPLFNFKRRSEAQKLDTNLGKEISGKLKRRKLVRPSFGANNAYTSAGKEHTRSCTPDSKHNHLDVGGNHLDIDLNVPALAGSDPVEEDKSIAVCPSVDIKIQSEKLCEADVKKPSPSNVIEAIKEQNISSFNNSVPAQNVSVESDAAELNMMDESKLRTILGQMNESKLRTILSQASSLLQEFGLLAGKKSEAVRSSTSGEDRKVNMAMSSDGSTRSECN